MMGTATRSRLPSTKLSPLIKAFSHTPYNLMRLDSFGMEDLLPFTTIYNFPMDVRGHSRSEVKSKLNLG